MVDEIIYRGISSVENLKNHNPCGIDVIVFMCYEWSNFPRGEEAKRTRDPSFNRRTLSIGRTFVVMGSYFNNIIFFEFFFFVLFFIAVD